LVYTLQMSAGNGETIEPIIVHLQPLLQLFFLAILFPWHFFFT
jgi:hypothetical protein